MTPHFRCHHSLARRHTLGPDTPLETEGSLFSRQYLSKIKALTGEEVEMKEKGAVAAALSGR